MRKVDLLIYKDKIKKLHKAALAMQDAHVNYETFINEQLLDDEFNSDNWNQLRDFMINNEDLNNKIDEIESILRKITHSNN